MPWLLASLGHQQPWYWLCRVHRENKVNTMAADALAPCVARPSAAMILAMQSTQGEHVNTMAADALAPCVARPSAAMILTMQSTQGEQGQYHGCSCPGPLQCQAISSYDIYYVEYIHRENKVNTMAADALAPCIARPSASAAMILTMQSTYTGRTRSIPWLMMPWLLASPGH